MKRFFFFIILIYCSIVALGQSFTLKGRVLDGNVSPIELATVSVLQQAKVTMINLKGEFSIQLHSADSVVVSFSMVGYKTKKRILRNPRGKQNLQIILYSDNNIDEIQVKGQKIQTTQTQELKNSDLKNINAASGKTVEESPLTANYHRNTTYVEAPLTKTVFISTTSKCIVLFL